jgi:hypothetical protein
MARKDADRDANEDGAALRVWSNLEQQNLEAFKAALEAARTIASRHAALASEAHRRLALLLWRSAVPPSLEDGASACLELAKYLLDTSFSHAAALTEMTTALQREALARFGRSAFDALALFEPYLRNGSHKTSGKSDAERE